MAGKIPFKKNDGVFIGNNITLVYPRCSMYGIFTYIWVIFGVNVGKYSSTMEHLGIAMGKLEEMEVFLWDDRL